MAAMEKAEHEYCDSSSVFELDEQCELILGRYIVPQEASSLLKTAKDRKIMRLRCLKHHKRKQMLNDSFSEYSKNTKDSSSSSKVCMEDDHEASDTISEVKSTSSMGTSVHLGAVRYGTKVDLWASGVLCYIMLCGVSPFNTSSEDKDNFGKSVSSKHIVVEKIRHCQYDFQSKIWNSVSDPAKELISELLVSSPRTRLSAEDMLRHSWLRSTKDSVEEGSILNRSGCKSGMKHGFVITALDKIVKDPNRTYHISASDGGRQPSGN